MKNLVIILCFTLLSGCALFEKTKNSEAVVTDSAVQVDPKALVPCPKLPNNVVTLTEEIMYENIELYKQYALCARKQDDSIRIIKRFANIKD